MPDRPLHILHLTAGSDAGGLSRYIYDLSMAMHERGHRVTVAGERGKWHGLFENAPWPWIELPLKGGPVALYRSAGVLEKYIRQNPRNPVDLIHAHYRRTTLVSRVLKRRLELPVLFTLHVTGISLRGINRFLSDFGDHTHVASAAARQWLIDEARLRPDRITLIPHGIDPWKFPVSDDNDRAVAQRELGLRENALVAGFVGRFDYPKNEEWMLDLLAAAQGKLPDLHILMIGEGPNETGLRDRIKRENLADRVTVLPYGDPRVVYRASDAILLTSGAEGFSYVNTEAMSTGRAVLRTRTAGTEEQIIEDVTGRSVAINRDKFITGALTFLSDRTALRRMGAAGAEHVRKNLTLEKQLDQTLALYRRMIDAKR